MPMISICDGTAPSKTGLRRIRHARGCLRHGLPLIRLALGEMGIDYLCHACHRWWHIPPAMALDNDPLLMVPALGADWWGWQVSEATNAINNGWAIWVQESGKGRSHLNQSPFFHCGRGFMRYPFPAKEDAKRCKVCAGGRQDA